MRGTDVQRLTVANGGMKRPEKEASLENDTNYLKMKCLHFQ